MHPVLCTIGPLTVYMYGLMLAVGAITGIAVGMHRAKRCGMDADHVFSIGLYGVLVGILGAKVLYVIIHLKEAIADPSMIISGDGFLIYGGIAAAFVFVWFFCRKKQKSFLDYFDLCIPSVPLAQGIGRFGCFFAGCCYGKPTDSFLGIVFPEGAAAPAGIPLWPTQLFSVAWNLLVAGFLILLSRKKVHRGTLGIWYLGLFGAGRFVIDFFRNDGQNVVGTVSVSQVTSAVMVLLGGAALAAIYLLRKKKAAAASEAEPEEEPTEEEAAGEEEA